MLVLFVVTVMSPRGYGPVYLVIRSGVATYTQKRRCVHMILTTKHYELTSVSWHSK